MLNLHNLETHLILKYKRLYPMDLVITDQCIVKYNRIFFTLLRVKTVLQMLKQCWKDLNSVEFRRTSGE